MSYIDRIEEMTKDIDLGKPIFKVNIRRGDSVELDEEAWSMDLSEHGALGRLITRHARRIFIKEEKRYVLNTDEIIDNIGNTVISNIIDVFVSCSPYDKPRRTKVFKSFYQTVRRNQKNQEFRNSIYDIYEYYCNSTQTDSIDHNNNDVHRKNIYQLLCLMEKSYGKEN